MMPSTRGQIMLAGSAIGALLSFTAAPSTPEATSAVTVQTEPSGDRAPRNDAEFDAMFRQISNWGRWGKDDQLGAMNLVTDAKRRQAASEVKLGLSVSL